MGRAVGLSLGSDGEAVLLKQVQETGVRSNIKIVQKILGELLRRVGVVRHVVECCEKCCKEPGWYRLLGPVLKGSVGHD